MPVASQELRISAPAQDAWDVIRDPMDLSWLPFVLSCEDLGNGVRRIVVDIAEYQGIDSETLVSEERCFNVDDESRSYNYTFSGEELPISDHVATLRIDDNGDGACTFHWFCDWTLDDGVSPEVEREIAEWVESHWLIGMRAVKEKLET